METERLRYPMVLKEEENGRFRLVMDKDDLGSCGGDARVFVEKLQGKGLLSSSAL